MKKYLMISISFFAVIIVLFNISNNDEVQIIESDSLKNDIFENIEENLADVNEYIVYGTYLNISGELSNSLVNSQIDNISLVLKDIDAEELDYDVNYNLIDDTIEFSTSDKINVGINLENIPIGNYYILLKIESNIDNVKSDSYYLLNNNTEYENIEYYTITNNNTNNLITIDSNEYSLNNNIMYMNLICKQVELPYDVYDIVIDPGHGGNDCGAVYDEYYESELVLEYSLSLKEKLENLGLKVKLTREEDEYIDAYGDEGRGVIPNIVKAKYVFSIHLNSNEFVINNGGVEVYCPSNSNLSFGKLIADNIVSIANTSYSANLAYKVDDGVYVRNFTEEEIIESKEDANMLGYKEYNITKDTSYLFMIREPGALATNAYVDGRNTNYGTNYYYNSNIGVEGYLLELGYMNCENNLDNILNNKELYVQAISTSIEEYLNINN